MMGRGDHDFMNNMKPQKKTNKSFLGKITDTFKNLFSFHLPSLGGLGGLFQLPSFHLDGNTQILAVVFTILFTLLDVLLVFADDHNYLWFLPKWLLSPLHGFLQPQEWVEQAVVSHFTKMVGQISSNLASGI